jgi:hypothetical protein
MCAWQGSQAGSSAFDHPMMGTEFAGLNLAGFAPLSMPQRDTQGRPTISTAEPPRCRLLIPRRELHCAISFRYLGDKYRYENFLVEVCAIGDLLLNIDLLRPLDGASGKGRSS